MSDTQTSINMWRPGSLYGRSVLPHCAAT